MEWHKGNKVFEFEKRLNQARYLENAKHKIKALVAEHLQTLARKRKQGIIFDDYGGYDASKWNKECQYFWKKIVLPKLTPDECAAVLKYGLSELATELIEEPARLEGKRISGKKEQNGLSYDDNMSPLDYERFCAAILTRQGWDCSLTKASGDQGVDILAKKRKHLLVVQCKKYSS